MYLNYSIIFSGSVHISNKAREYLIPVIVTCNTHNQQLTTFLFDIPNTA